MSTYIMTKRDFLETVAKLIKDDQMVVMTRDIYSAEDLSRGKVKRITFQFASDAFGNSGLSPFLGKNRITCSFCVANREDIHPRHLTVEENASASLDPGAT